MSGQTNGMWNCYRGNQGGRQQYDSNGNHLGVYRLPICPSCYKTYTTSICICNYPLTVGEYEQAETVSENVEVE